jgi:hypothetical protein
MQNGQNFSSVRSGIILDSRCNLSRHSCRDGNVLKKLLILFFFVLPSLCYSQNSDSLELPYHFINSVPQNAEVYINGSLSGLTPYRIEYKPGDSVRIRIDILLKNYNDVNYTIQPGEKLNRTFLLVPQSTTVNRDKIVFENKSQYFKSSRRIIPIILSSVIAGGTAVLSYCLKKRANEFYDDYRLTGSQSMLDKAKQYDVYTGISISVMQVSLGGLIYFLLIE